MPPVPDTPDPASGMSPEVIVAIALGIPSLFVALLSLYLACRTFSLSRTHTRTDLGDTVPPIWWLMYRDLEMQAGRLRYGNNRSRVRLPLAARNRP